MTRPGDGWDRVGEEMLEKAALELDKKQPQFNQKFIDAIRARHAADIWYLEELEVVAAEHGINPAIFEDGPGSGRRWYPGEIVSRYKNRFPDSEWPAGRAFASKPVPPPLRVIEETWKPPKSVIAVKVDTDAPRVVKSVPESIEPIQGQYYDAFKGQEFIGRAMIPPKQPTPLTKDQTDKIKRYVGELFNGKPSRPIIVANNQPRLSSDGSTLVSDAYHWLPIANAPLNTKLQLINRADGVANYGTITNSNRHLFTHYAELPTFAD